MDVSFFFCYLNFGCVHVSFRMFVIIVDNCTNCTWICLTTMNMNTYLCSPKSITAYKYSVQTNRATAAIKNEWMCVCSKHIYISTAQTNECFKCKRHTRKAAQPSLYNGIENENERFLFWYWTVRVNNSKKKCSVRHTLSAGHKFW